MRIVSDGTGRGTKVYTDGGEDISKQVRRVEINPIEVFGIVTAKVEFVGVKLDVVTKTNPVVAFIERVRHQWQR